MCDSIDKDIKRKYEDFEKDGFVSTFFNPYPLLEQAEIYKDKKFTVIRRADTSEICAEDDPSWIIRFKDGHEMTAYPEEICKSKIPNWIIEDSSNIFKELAFDVCNQLKDIEASDVDIRCISGFTYQEWVSNETHFMLLIMEVYRLLILHPTDCRAVNKQTVFSALRNTGMTIKGI